MPVKFANGISYYPSAQMADGTRNVMASMPLQDSHKVWSIADYFKAGSVWTYASKGRAVIRLKGVESLDVLHAMAHFLPNL
ncbi:hypothetical protein [Spirillospora sp. NPDC047279]|uniref:hypothetical protein n=1 Tax=Spirillospora sp. NPDC047279 TaxID=3155478 RepID=UPI0033C84F6B